LSVECELQDIHEVAHSKVNGGSKKKINPIQTTFIWGRYIIDGAVMIDARDST
jgi:hypothetical protein